MKKLYQKSIGVLLNSLTWLVPKFARNFAFDLLSRVKRVPITQDSKEFFELGITHWLDVSGTRTALHRWGDGPKKILFIHGWQSHSQRWQPFITAFDKSQFTCYALDAPGHGMSEGNKLNLEIFRKAYSTALNWIGSIDAVIGHSFGNLAIIYQYLYQKKSDASSYVILGAPSGMDSVFQYFRDVFGTSDFMLNNLSVKIDEVFKIPYRSITMTQFFIHIDKPVLVVHEETDEITPVQPIKKAVLNGRMAETYFTTGLSHTLKEEQAINKVKEFIQQHTQITQHVH